MQIGVVYPQTEIEPDKGAVRHYAKSVESMGFTHVMAYDHVIGANTASRPDWKKPYNIDSAFQEPLVLFAFMAGATERIGFVSAVIILSQRQTVLVAKQAACVDALCGGRLRVGIGTGWNDIEYEALGMPFEERGKRIEEQVTVLRALWTNRAVTFSGDFHTISDAGLKPMPVQQPIPIWFGGGSDRLWFKQKARDSIIRRIARIGDGWLPQWGPDDRGRELLGHLREYCAEIGRDPAEIGLEGNMLAPLKHSANWAQTVESWRAIGATHVSINTMGDGLFGVDAHLERLAAFREAVPA